MISSVFMVLLNVAQQKLQNTKKEKTIAKENRNNAFTLLKFSSNKEYKVYEKEMETVSKKYNDSKKAHILAIKEAYEIIVAAMAVRSFAYKKTKLMLEAEVQLSSVIKERKLRMKDWVIKNTDYKCAKLEKKEAMKKHSILYSNTLFYTFNSDERNALHQSRENYMKYVIRCVDKRECLMEALNMYKASTDVYRALKEKICNELIKELL